MAKEVKGIYHKMIFIVVGAIYVGYTIAYMAGAIPQNLLTVISMNAVCSLVLNECAFTHEKRFYLHIINPLFFAFIIISTVFFTILYIRNSCFELCGEEVIMLVSAFITVVASGMNVFLKEKSRGKVKKG